jgi:hypothetical protein
MQNHALWQAKMRRQNAYLSAAIFWQAVLTIGLGLPWTSSIRLLR